MKPSINSSASSEESRSLERELLIAIIRKDVDAGEFEKEEFAFPGQMSSSNNLPSRGHLHFPGAGTCVEIRREGSNINDVYLK
ncbi:hypothetical protein NPIL_501371 [Nephila pilipes]|uniref:Uncharacterized protein n=1 Tax=Nephila pilipes TaxID=299642 RepID=A0A8X6QAW6_NEPPI|nr:hypothetical protein NPIL_501371 [Nephila pilipes]